MTKLNPEHPRNMEIFHCKNFVLDIKKQREQESMCKQSSNETSVMNLEIEVAIAGAVAAYLKHDQFKIKRIKEKKQKDTNDEGKKSFWSQNLDFLLSIFGSRKDSE